MNPPISHPSPKHRSRTSNKVLPEPTDEPRILAVEKKANNSDRVPARTTSPLVKVNKCDPSRDFAVAPTFIAHSSILNILWFLHANLSLALHKLIYSARICTVKSVR